MGKDYCSESHVGHDGTRLKFSELTKTEVLTTAKEVGPAGTSPVDQVSVTAHSPIEPFEIIPWIPIMKIENLSHSQIYLS